MKWQLARLAGDVELREQLRAAGLAQARQFDWRKTAEMTLDVYSQAIAQARNPQPTFARTGATSATVHDRQGAPVVSA